MPVSACSCRCNIDRASFPVEAIHFGQFLLFIHNQALHKRVPFGPQRLYLKKDFDCGKWQATLGNLNTRDFVIKFWHILGGITLRILKIIIISYHCDSTISVFTMRCGINIQQGTIDGIMDHQSPPQQLQ